MNTITTLSRVGILDRLRGPSSDDRAAWLEARRQGCSATEARDLAKGYGADRRRIKIEKLTGERPDLTGNRYIERGNVREPFIAAWIEENFDIAPNQHVFIDAAKRGLCTPDGVSNWFEFDGLLAEIKTSKHDLTPGPIEQGVLRMELVDGSWRRSHFWTTGYYDQMQWQMYVLNGARTLFVWEQHDDNWPDPQPLHDSPSWCWVLRDEKRISELRAIVDDFLDELDRSHPDELPAMGSFDAEEALLVQRLLKYRDDEAVAKKAKEDVWKQLQAKRLAEGAPDFQAENDVASMSVTTTTKDVAVLDEAKMREKAPRLVAQYEALVQRYTVVKTETKRTLNVTAKKKKG